MRILLAGEGAIARQHAAAIARIDDAEIVLLAGGVAERTEQFAAEHDIPEWTLDLDEGLARDDVDAVILATPTPLHAPQAIRSLEAGKPTLVEIPMAESLADAEAIAQAADASGVVAMVAHTRRFNPSHQWINQRITDGELRLQHLVASTFFLRRDNRNALGEPRSWTDHLLWHHACHTVDLLVYQTGEPIVRAWASQGPVHPELGIALDLSIGLATESGVLCTLALSFNNDGPLGTVFRYIGDRGTYLASYDDLEDGYGNAVDLSGFGPEPNGFVLQDAELIAAIREGRQPRSSIHDGLASMRVLDQLERSLESARHDEA